MQALMLAAGMGKRLGRYTKNGTKCMVQVNGKALIEYAIEALVSAGIKKFTLVIGYRGDVLKDFIASKFNESNLNGMQIEYIENSVYDKTNNIYSLYLAKHCLTADDTILLESDLIFNKQIICDIINNPEKNLAVVSPFENWMDGTCTLLDSETNIVGMLDKAHFKWEDIKDYYKTVNIYKLSKDFSRQYYIPFLEAYQTAFGKNEYYETVLKVLTLLDTKTLKGFVVPGEAWYEIDDPADLAIAETRFSDSTNKIKLLQRRYGGYWRFPQLLDFCYLVNPYFPPKNLVRELECNFETLLTQYPSGAAEQSLLAGKIFKVLPENIAVGNGAAELISSFCKNITGKIAIPFPTFNEYPARFTNAEIVAVPVDKETFAYTAEDIIRTVKETGAKSVLLINPDNPSGNFIAKDDALNLLKELKALGATLIFDESFIDFAQRENRYTLINQEILQEFTNLIVIKSISKSYGVPGLRLGVLASGNAELVEKVKKTNSIWNINSFGEYFMQIYEKYSKFYSAACDAIADERSRFYTALSNIMGGGIKPFPSSANYLLCKLPTSISSATLCEKLISRYNIFIKDLSDKKGFQNGNYIRIAIRNKADNDRLLHALSELLS